jgi:asparagine synthase (glutamine-hydrolysing)
MCGIAGVFRRGGAVGPEDVAAVERATSVQSHRGPDDSGIYRDSRAVLGHRRLSIIDLSPSGHQPMSNEDGTVWVTYNGEIYNYRELRPELSSRGHSFRSNSDTEILIHGYEEWGIEGLLQRLRGMYAFGLYDWRQARCILARDRFGIKPLYYCQPAGQEVVAFASEVKALVRSGLSRGERNREGIVGFLLFGSVPAPLTSIEGVECLLPGHYLVAGREGVSVHKYWDLNPEPLRRGEETEGDLGATLQDSVARHLISDVPAGIFLSGGVDSAGLVALAKRASARLSTLTVVFDEKEFSEAALARQVAERFGTDHQEVRITGEDFMAELPKLLSAMDQPTNDGVNTYFVSRAARQAGLTVVLSGLGGDEIFWGYKHYRWLSTYKNPLRWLSPAPAMLRKGLLNAAVAYGRVRGRENLMRLGVLKKRLSVETMYMAVRGFFAPEQVARLLDMDSGELGRSLDHYIELMRPTGVRGGRDGADAFSHIEAVRYMHDQLLRDTDVFSMAHSIEVRVPYLDHCVTDLALELLTENKRPGLINKPALVRAINDDLVSELGRQQKRGFAFPFARWMRKNTARLQEAAGQTKLLDPTAVRKLWAAFDDGRLHWSRAWATVVLAQR